MAKTITAANAIYTLAISGLLDVPVALQGFAADDVFSTDALDTAEVLMGVDGNLSAGFIFKEVRQTITLQADSDSNSIFDTWYGATVLQRDTYFASGAVLFPGLKQEWTLTKGVLMNFMPVPDAKKLLQPRKFVIVWQSVSPANIP